MYWRPHIVTKLRVLRFLSRYPVTNGMLNGRVTQLDVSIPVYFALGGARGVGGVGGQEICRNAMQVGLTP